MAHALPASQRPRIAPFGRVVEVVHSERPQAWAALFHQDGRHLSPSGSYLLAAVLYASLFGQLPPAAAALPPDSARLWSRARYMQEPEAPLDSVEPMPTLEEAAYLVEVVGRTVLGSWVNATWARGG